MTAEIKPKRPEALNSLASLTQALIGSQDEITSFNQIDRTTIYTPLTLNRTRLAYLYKTHGVLQTALSAPVYDALRGGVELSGEMDSDDIRRLLKLAKQLKVFRVVRQAKIWARLFGGAAIIVNTEAPPEAPLSEKQLLGRIQFYACNRWELTSVQGYKPSANDLESMVMGNYSKRSDEFFYFYGKRIHHSRVTFLDGEDAPDVLKWQLQGWGMSTLEKIVEKFNLYLRTDTVIYELLKKAKVDTLLFKDFNDTLLSDDGTNKLYNRIALAGRLMNYQNILAMDAEDKYESHTQTFAGLADMAKINMMGMACACRMPMTKLFGLSASGFNSGEDDIENYNAMVESEVREDIEEPLRHLMDLLCIPLFGYVPEYEMKFKPLRVMSSLDEENIKKSKQERVEGLFDRALLNSHEVGQICEKEGLVQIDTEMAAGALDDHPISPMAQLEAGAGDDDEEGGGKDGKPGAKKKPAKKSGGDE